MKQVPILVHWQESVCVFSYGILYSSGGQSAVQSLWNSDQKGPFLGRQSILGPCLQQPT